MTDGGRSEPTIYDVARAAGVASSTVSRALSKPGRVSFRTAEHVRRVADELGRTPLAATYAPVPGFARRSAAVTLAELHPWPWLARPAQQRLTSFSAWRKGVRR